MGVTQPGLLQRTKAFFCPPGVASLAELEAFVTGEAAYLAQKTVFGYCRVKTVTNFEKLMTEPAFRDGVELRSEEHTSELQTLMRISYADFCLTKKTSNTKHTDRTYVTESTQHDSQIKGSVQ